jgi:hypothetical protein
LIPWAGPAFTSNYGVGVRGTRRRLGLYQGRFSQSPGGYGLQVDGRAVFSRSGKASFAKGQASKTITAAPIAPASLVLATIQGVVAGTWVMGVSLSDANDTVTIRLNETAPVALTVGWFIVN